MYRPIPLLCNTRNVHFLETISKYIIDIIITLIPYQLEFYALFMGL